MAARPPRPLLVVLVVAGLLISGCSASGGGEAGPDPTPAPTTEVEPGPDSTTTEPEETTTTEPDGPTTTTTEAPPEPSAPPAIGDCWSAITAAQLEEISFTGDEADCADPHGGLTVEVRTISSGLADQITPEILAADPNDEPEVFDLIQEAGTDGCTNAWIDAEKRLRMNPGISSLAVVIRATKLGRTFWLPTAAEWEAGARWIRCDLQTTDETEFKVRDLSTVGRNGVPPDLVQCLDESSPTGTEVPCDSSAARWQAIAAFELTDAAAPTDQASYRALLERSLPLVCEQLARVAVGRVGQRSYRIFAPANLDAFGGRYLCAAQVEGPVDRPLGT